MSWAVIQKNVLGKPVTYRKFIVDTIDDLSTLPVVPAVGAGSEAYCSEDGKTYILETDSDWVVKGGTTISSLSDTDISNPQNGQTLVYNSETDKWENDSSGGGSEPFIVTLTEDEEHDPPDTFDYSIEGYYVADRTYVQIHNAFKQGKTILYCIPDWGRYIECTLSEHYDDDEEDIYYINSSAGFDFGSQQELFNIQGNGTTNDYNGYTIYNAELRSRMNISAYFNISTGTLSETNGVFSGMYYNYGGNLNLVGYVPAIKTNGTTVNVRIRAYCVGVTAHGSDVDLPDNVVFMAMVCTDNTHLDIVDTIYIFRVLRTNASATINDPAQFTYETIPLQSLTPLVVTVASLDTNTYTGTLDHTASEIKAAYDNGQKIIFIHTSGDLTIKAECTQYVTDSNYQYGSVCATWFDISGNYVWKFYTNFTNDPDDNTFAMGQLN